MELARGIETSHFKPIQYPLLKTTPVLQIRDFQLVGQWAEGLKGILSPQVVQKRCIFYFQEALKMVKIKVDLFYITYL